MNLFVLSKRVFLPNYLAAFLEQGLAPFLRIFLKNPSGFVPVKRKASIKISISLCTLTFCPPPGSDNTFLLTVQTLVDTVNVPHVIN